METPEPRDVVVPLDGMPQSSVGAPHPLVVQEEGTCLLAFYVQERAGAEEEQVALVRFEGVHAVSFGAPNDETLHGHPLVGRGLRSYGAFEVLHSSWVRALERMNSVHPRHMPARFRELRHVVLTFHDSTFECAARGMTCSVQPGPPQMTQFLTVMQEMLASGGARQ